MYPVSSEYMKAIQNNTRSYYFEGVITTKLGIKYPFTNKDIVKGSGYITNQCCGNSEIEIGSVYSAELGISLYTDMNRYSLEGATISMSFFLELSDKSYEEVPLGIFEISEANRKTTCLEIKAYDYMLRFEKAFNNKVGSGTVYDFIALACKECKVTLAQTKEEIESLKNAKTMLSIYSENDIETWRDVIYYAAQVLGCFATINRNGKLEFRKYGNEAVVDIPDTQRFSSTFSDFVTRYTAVSSTNSKTQTAEYYALNPDDGLTMNLGVNPLLQFGLAESRKAILTNVLNDLSKINYVPFDSSTIGNPAFDLGDIITFSGGHADKKQITCITKYQYKINGKHSLQCVGKNPRLSVAKSKNDKNISGLLNQVEAGKITIYTYINASPYKLSESKTEICAIEFASNEDTEAQFHASILLNVSADKVIKTGKVKKQVLESSKTEGSSDVASAQTENGTDDSNELSFEITDDGQAVLTVNYIINDEMLTTYVPVETMHSGMHIVNLYYPISGLKGNSYNTFKVRLSITGGTASIDRGQSICTISGQGLASNSTWDGRLEFEEKFDKFISLSAGMIIKEFNDSVASKTLQIPKPVGLSEEFANIGFGTFNLMDMSETAKINPVVVTETIDTTDVSEMTFDTFYVNTADERFELMTAYKIRGKEETISSGRMQRISVNSEQYACIDNVEVSVNE